MHENDRYPGVPERIQLMDENGTVHEHPPTAGTSTSTTLARGIPLMYTTCRFDDEANRPVPALLVSPRLTSQSPIIATNNDHPVHTSPTQ